MSGIIENLPEILTALGSVAALWFTYNQYTKNKLTDYKVEKWKNEERQRDIKKYGVIASIYGELWELLYALNADRVFVVQPHPLYRAVMLTATLEVKRFGVATALDDFVNVPLDTMAKFSSRLSKEDLIVINNVEQDDIEANVKSAIVRDGSQAVLIKRLSDDKNNWIGNVIVTYHDSLDNCGVNMEEAKALLESNALTIQYELPEYKTAEDK